MDSKSILINNIKEWIHLNNQINIIQNNLKELKLKKKNISNELIAVMEKNEIDRFDINNGKLVYRKNKIKVPLNKDYLIKMLDNYFKEYPEVDINDVSQFILNNRPIKENTSLVIKQNK